MTMITDRVALAAMQVEKASVLNAKQVAGAFAQVSAETMRDLERELEKEILRRQRVEVALGELAARVRELEARAGISHG
ncbi:hypothetical protein ACTSKR_09560 [Chitinibacteraceae bacterium HSL-7]